ncbi:MAG: 4-alpha-glucanotransferase [Actinomycetia bacterium]|nr:4-alpha-glucanotransferase [Actinomycetes bacterium]
MVDLAAWGIDDGYWDSAGNWREVPDDTLRALAEAMEAGDRERPPDAAPMWFIRAGHVEFLQGAADLVLEDGTTIRNVEALPPDLPPGYHELVPRDGGPTTRLVVTPGRCHLPHDLRTWGWAVQLYAARSAQSWGIGDLADLRWLQAWAAERGAGVLALNPLHAAGPAFPQQPSPYYPSSRCFRNPLYLRVEEVPGVGDVEKLAAAGRALNDERHIDRDQVWALKQEALEGAFLQFTADEGFDAFLAEHGPALPRFATYCAIAEEHGNGWQDWPAELQRPDSPAVAAYATGHAERVRFHCWLQWQVDEQLARTTTVPVIHDLAVGFDPGGADAWAWQDVLALDMRVGAPPDEFNTAGQDWGLPPFVPWKLRAAGYQPLIETFRACFRRAGGLRVDHVMGLFRLFWLPASGGPGGYVRYPAGEILDILALESYRADAFVVGEDLGTVEDHVRADLHERQVLSYRLLWFEPEPPDHYPEQALAAVTTHDLPTVAGAWSRSDRDDQRSAGLSPNVGGEDQVRHRLQAAAGLDDGASVEEAVVGAYRALSRAPSRVVLATLDDAFAVTERPNMPGTVDQWPNWSLALPRPIESLDGDPLADAIGQSLRSRG